MALVILTADSFTSPQPLGLPPLAVAGSGRKHFDTGISTPPTARPDVTAADPMAMTQQVIAVARSATAIPGDPDHALAGPAAHEDVPVWDSPKFFVVDPDFDPSQ